MAGVEIGKTRRGNSFSVSAPDRALGMHIIGAPGSGKTKLLEHMLRQDIENRVGFCLIDPHGHLYEEMVRWCETKRYFDRRKLVLLDASTEGQWTFAFNPLHVYGESQDALSFCVDSMVNVCAQVWGGEDTARTPLLKRILRSVFHALAAKKLTLLEAQSLSHEDDRQGLRRYITEGIEDDIFRAEWEGFNAMSAREYREVFSSTRNRLLEFLGAPIIRRIIGQTTRALDCRRIMDDGYMILVNLSSKGRLTQDNARLLGSLLVNDFFVKALARPEGSRPFYLYIDECARFLNSDIEDILTQTRKFGLHLVLAHQLLSQLRAAGEPVYRGVMGGAQTKVVFRMRDPADALEMADVVFEKYNLEEPKRSFDRPTVVGYRTTVLRQASKTRGKTVTRGEDSSEGESASVRGDGEDTTTTSHVLGSRFSESESESATGGWSETLEPILEMMATQAYSLEEQRHKAQAVLRQQPERYAMVASPVRAPVRVRVPEVKKGFAGPERVAKATQRAYELSEFISPIQLVEQEIKERHLQLKEGAKQAKRKRLPTDHKGSFKEPR